MTNILALYEASFFLFRAHLQQLGAPCCSFLGGMPLVSYATASPVRPCINKMLASSIEWSTHGRCKMFRIFTPSLIVASHFVNAHVKFRTISLQKCPGQGHAYVDLWFGMRDPFENIVCLRC